MTQVQFPSPEVEFILGPQLKSGTDPRAAWYDEVEQRRGIYWAERMLSKDWRGATPDASDDLTVADNHYDLPRALYQVHYRTGDPKFLDLGRRTADRWWESPSIGLGDDTSVPGDEDAVPGNQKPPPIYSALAGLMLRALDGRPELWGFLDQKCRAEMDNWIKARVANPVLYSDLRDSGYVQLYAVLLAKVLPDAFDLYANGTDKPSTGRVTDGAARRAAYLADAEHAAVNYFGRLQWPDGSWRWSLWDGTMKDFEQPFMLGIYFESVTALHGLTTKADVKASLLTQLTRGCEHLYRDTYRNRATSYYFPLSLQTWANEDRHLHTSFIHAFGFAYKVTGEAKWKQQGDELWDSAFGGSDGKRALMDSVYHPKEWSMEVRTSGRYPAYTATAVAPAPVPLPTPAPQPTPAPALPEYSDWIGWPKTETAQQSLWQSWYAKGYACYQHDPRAARVKFRRFPAK